MHSGLNKNYIKSLGLSPSRLDFLLHTCPRAFWQQTPPELVLIHLTKAASDSISKTTIIPKKSNPWFDEEYMEALKARQALDKKIQQRQEFRGEALSAFSKSWAQARQLFNQRKRQSWADTPIKHVWDTVRKIYEEVSGISNREIWGGQSWRPNTHSPGPDGIHNNLLKHLPGVILKTLKEILNKIWTYADFPHQ